MIVGMPSRRKSHLKPARAGCPRLFKYEHPLANRPENAPERLPNATKKASL